MGKEILTQLQKKFIILFGKDKAFRKRFYLTGGTALAAYYLNHRYSEDLDFFTSDEIDVLALDVLLKDLKAGLGVSKIDYEQSYNRNLFFLHAKKETLKVEFTYFPFEHIEKPAIKDNVGVDSLTDIAVNKAFTISQNPRARDFIDLYLILEKQKKLSFKQLLKMARGKFDWHIDPIQLGMQLSKARELKDLPRMLHKIDHKVWRDFFVKEANSLSKDIFG